MNTRQLLVQHHALVSAGKADEAAAFVQKNAANKRFFSLIELGNNFLSAFRQELDARGARLA
jgi:hypothetical protein